MNFNRVYALILRHYFLALKQLERFFDVLISPILMVVLWGFLTKYVQGFDASNLAGFLLGGILLWIIFEKVSTDIGVNFMFDIWDRNLIPLMSSPITFVEFLTGLVLVSLVKIIVAFTVMVIMASIFYNFQITSLGFGLAFFVLNLFLFATSFGIFNVALVLRFGNSVGPLTWIIPFLISGYVSLSSMIAAAVLPAVMFMTKQPRELLALGLVFCVFVLVRHAPNIKRLLAGQERQVNFPFKRTH